MNPPYTARIGSTKYLIYFALSIIIECAPGLVNAQLAAQTPQPANQQQRLVAMEAAITIGGAYRTWKREFGVRSTPTLVDWFNRNCEPDFKVKLLDSKSETRSEVQAWVKKVIPSLKFGEQASIKLKRFKIDGNTTTVTLYGSCGEILAEPAAASAKGVKQLVARDIWTKTPHGWRLKYREILPEDKEVATARL